MFERRRYKRYCRRMDKELRRMGRVVVWENPYYSRTITVPDDQIIVFGFGPTTIIKRKKEDPECKSGS